MKIKVPSEIELLTKKIDSRCDHENYPWIKAAFEGNFTQVHNETTLRGDESSLAFATIAVKLEQIHDMQTCFYRSLRLYEKCESPIERLFVLAFKYAGESTYENYACPVRFILGESDKITDGASIYWIEPQVKFDKYRIDFKITLTDDFFHGTYRSSVFIECDGHDFHERTKEQAKHDRTKDRLIQKKGETIFRFTGSELWADPFKCVAEVMTALSDKTHAQYVQNKPQTKVEAKSEAFDSEWLSLLREYKNEQNKTGLTS